MLKKKIQLTLLSFVMLGLANFPVQAQTTNSQDAGQSATINGDNNVVDQTIYQTVIIRPVKKNGNNWKDPKDRENHSFSRGNSEDKRNDKKGDHRDKD
jgi:hypothetical protein